MSKVEFCPKIAVANSPLPEDAPIAAFDVDGTITTQDSFVGFLKFWAKGQTNAGRPTFYWGKIATIIPFFLAYKLGIISRHQVKEKVCLAFFKNVKRQDFDHAARGFAAQYYFDKIRPKFAACLAAHKSQGHRLVMVSASLTDYLLPLAHQLGFDDLIATQLAVDGQKLSGRLNGPNCWGPLKAASIKGNFPAAQLIAAYGDSRGDREMLALARTDGGVGHFRPFED